MTEAITLTAIIDRFEEDKAVLLLSSDAEQTELPVIWPRKYLPNTKEGSVLKISFTADEAATHKTGTEHKELLQKLLNQQK